MVRGMVLDFGRLLGKAFLLAVAIGLLLTLAAAALPAQEKDAVAPGEATSGRLLVRRADAEPWAAAPTLSTEVLFRVAGVVARASVKQRFRNASDGWMEGVYVFPLPENAAVDHLLMHVGERTIEGQIREREQAQAEYQQAKGEGKKASLVEQERPNVFTTSVANLGPGEEVSVEIEFQQTLRFDEGEVRLRFPLVVGPRYVPGQPTDTLPEGLGWAADTDAVPDASRITPPVLGPGIPPRNPVAIDVELDPGFPLLSLVSRYHPVVSEPLVDGRYHVTLRDALVPADRDFELAWRPRPGTMPRGAAFLEEKDGATYALVTLFPPSGDALEEARLPREVVFVIDTSGSMEGPSIQQARAALVLAIDRLRPGDRFNVIRFSDSMEPLFDVPRPLTPSTRRRAHSWVEGLKAGGGTEMAPALEAALVGGGDESQLVHEVVFLTDGAVANEEQLFALIRQRLLDTRLFTVGIGAAPNGHFLAKAAELGHGTFTWVGDVHEVEQEMGRLFAALENPVLTGVEVRWPPGAAAEAWPQRLPDLYLGEPLLVSARLEGRADSVLVRGRRLGQVWQASLDLTRPLPEGGVAVLWAQRKSQALLDSLHDGAPADEVRAAVVALGLEHHLVTRYTSLVAVEVTPGRPTGAGLPSLAVPASLPRGWSYEAVFGELPQGGTQAPRDAVLALGSLLLALALWSLAGGRPARARQ